MKYFEEKDIEEVATLLRRGKIIAFPTETVYGLAVVSNNYKSYKKLVKIKKRDPNKPFTMMISDINQIKDFVEINDLTKKLIEKYMPGEITLVLKKKDNKIIPNYLDLSTGFIGIRMPNKKFLLELIDRINIPLLVPSANPKDLKPALNYFEVYDYFKENIDGIVKGEIGSTLPSTVIKIDEKKLYFIREGKIKFEDIKKELNYENCDWFWSWRIWS